MSGGRREREKCGAIERLKLPVDAKLEMNKGD